MGIIQYPTWKGMTLQKRLSPGKSFSHYWKKWNLSKNSISRKHSNRLSTIRSVILNWKGAQYLALIGNILNRIEDKFQPIFNKS